MNITKLGFTAVAVATLLNSITLFWIVYIR